MTIGKRASMTGISILLLFVAATAVLAQTRANKDQADPILRQSGQVRAAAQAPIRNQAATAPTADATLAVQPAHAVASRTSNLAAPAARNVNDAVVSPDPQLNANLTDELPNDPKVYAASEKAYYATANEIAYYRTGLKFTITDIQIPADRRPVVTFKVTDDAGQPLDRLGVLTPGAVSSSFILAYLPKASNGSVTDYVDYSTRSQTSPITGKTALQAGTDSGGTYTASGQLDGIYTYRFGTVLPSNYDVTATHTIGMYGRRDLREFGFSFYVSNPIKNFVPNGSAVTQVHSEVLTSSCNQCHDPLALHGETGRREVEICVLCHSPQTVDPDTGNTVDMKVFIHKIHRGGNLPSVKAGTPYVIIGNAQSVNDYSDVTYPQDIRNCTTCHQGTSQVNAWNLQPSMEACGSCHDDIVWTTGANHTGGIATDNSKCATCHLPQGQFEFDASVIGAHTVPYKSKQLLLPKLNIISVTNTAPGQKPIIKFTVTDKNNNLLAPSLFTGTGRISLNFAGSATDFTTRTSETMTTPPAYVNNVATYNANFTVPATATGTWVLETEARLQANLMIGGDPKNLSAAQRDAAPNTMTYFAVTGTTVVPRRSIVAIALCNKCHNELGKASFDLSTFHGGGRNDSAVCSVCHTTTFVSGSGATATPISFQVMVHRIHTGNNLTNSYVVGGTDFKEVTYPGDRRNCTACHVGTSYQLPLPSTNLAVTTPNWYWTPTQPMAAACLACHDTVSSAAHAFINTTTFGGSTVTAESCPVCHQEGADFAVVKSHAR